MRDTPNRKTTTESPSGTVTCARERQPALSLLGRQPAPGPEGEGFAARSRFRGLPSSGSAAALDGATVVEGFGSVRRGGRLSQSTPRLAPFAGSPALSVSLRRRRLERRPGARLRPQSLLPQWIARSRRRLARVVKKGPAQRPAKGDDHGRARTGAFKPSGITAGHLGPATDAFVAQGAEKGVQSLPLETPGGWKLVVEVFTLRGQADGSFFFIRLQVVCSRPTLRSG